MQGMAKQIEKFWKVSRSGISTLIRTVTMTDTGVLVSIDDHEIILKVDAAWIADTGRFNETLKSVEFSEVEPFPNGLVAVGRGSLIDAVRITKSPRVVK